MRRLPAEHFLEEAPRIVKCRFRRIVCDVRGNNCAIGLGLARRRKAELLKQHGRHHQPDRPDEIEPFQIGIALEIGRHALPGRRPEIDQADRLQTVRMNTV